MFSIMKMQIIVFEKAVNLRSYFKAAEGKPGVAESVRFEFKKNSTAIPKSDTMHIEHLMRNGKRKLKMIKVREQWTDHYTMFSPFGLRVRIAVCPWIFRTHTPPAWGDSSSDA